MAKLITDTIGDGCLSDLSLLQNLKSYADDKNFRARLYKTQQAVKQRLIDFKKQELGMELNINALFEIQVKRIHEYMRKY